LLLSLLPHGSIVFLELLDLILAHIISKIGTLWLLKGTVVVGRVIIWAAKAKGGSAFGIDHILEFGELIAAATAATENTLGCIRLGVRQG